MCSTLSPVEMYRYKVDYQHNNTSFRLKVLWIYILLACRWLALSTRTVFGLLLGCLIIKKTFTLSICIVAFIYQKTSADIGLLGRVCDHPYFITQFKKSLWYVLFPYLRSCVLISSISFYSESSWIDSKGD